MLTLYNIVWLSLYMYVSVVYIRTSVYVCIHTWCGVCSRVSVDISVCVFVCVRDVCICVRSVAWYVCVAWCVCVCVCSMVCVCVCVCERCVYLCVVCVMLCVCIVVCVCMCV